MLNSEGTAENAEDLIKLYETCINQVLASIQTQKLKNEFERIRREERIRNERTSLRVRNSMNGEKQNRETSQGMRDILVACSRMFLRSVDGNGRDFGEENETNLHVIYSRNFIRIFINSINFLAEEQIRISF